MKTYLTTLLALVSGLILLVGAGGCYTQLGTTRDEEPRDYDSGNYADENEPAEEYIEDGGYSGYDAGYGEDWHSNVRVGFNYYYPYTYWPSIGFAAAYSDPWYHWYAYDPWYGYATPYNYYNPYWGYYSYGYGYPYHGGYHPYYGGYYPWYQTGVIAPRTNRTFGSTRGSGSSRRDVNASSGQDGMYRDGGTGGMTLPTASGRTVTGGTDARTTTSTKEDGNARSSGSSRNTGVNAGSSRTGTGVSPSSRGTGTDRDARRIYRDRGSVSGSGTRNSGDTKSSPAVESPGSAPSSGKTTRTSQGSGGTRTRGSSQPAVRPAPAPRPSSSAPRPSSSPSSSSGSSRSGSQRPRP